MHLIIVFEGGLQNSSFFSIENLDLTKEQRSIEKI